jgi:hypothetical protein
MRHPVITEWRAFRWADIEELPRGGYMSTWRMKVFRPASDAALAKIARSCSDSAEGFAVRLALGGRRELVARVRTRRWAMEADYFGLTFQLFWRIDRAYGIETIEDVPRSAWPPFSTELLPGA